MRRMVLFCCIALLGSLDLFSLRAQTAPPPANKSTARRSTARSGTAGGAPRPKITENLDAQLAKWQPYKVIYNSAGLSARERQLVDKLVEANHYIDYLYWRQSDPEGLALLKRLMSSRNPQDQKIIRMLRINGSRFDLLEENRPFVGSESISPGRGYYPEGITREEIDGYVAAHPEKKAAIYDEHSVVRRNGTELQGIPYHVAYREFLMPAAKLLRDAAALSDDPAFARFLTLRADALLSDDYYASDIAWLELNDPKFDIIYAPYETYLDGLLGIKTSYGGAVMIRNRAESEKLAIYQKFVPEIQEALPLPPEDRPSKQGHLTPMEVMDTPFRSGDLRHGYQAVADNLPNDPRIHQEKGSKKLFFKNFMDARVNVVILPIARRLMLPEQAVHASGEGYMASTVMHEICHGLGPAFARKNGQQVDIREAIGPAYSGLEEAKADTVGMFGLKWLVDKGVLSKDRLPEYYSSYVAGMFRTMRFGVAEAHGRAEMMEFNFLVEQGAITRDNSGRYRVDYEKMPAGIAALAKELLEIEASGDRQRGESLLARYDKMPEELKRSLAAVKDVPVDIDPSFPFPEPVQ